MITIFIWLVNRFINDNDWEVNMWLILTALIDGIIAWCAITDILIAYFSK